MSGTIEIFLSYSGDDSAEASLLQYAIEQWLSDLNVNVWTYERDQLKSTRQVAQSLKRRVQESAAVIFIASPSTFNSGATQWMELAYADAFNVPIFVLLHRLTFKSLKGMEKGVPPLLVEGQCNLLSDWKIVASDMSRQLRRKVRVRK